MRIGEVARLAGVNVETLRYYERRGLIDEPARGINGHREYDEETLRFVKAVKAAQQLGFTLEEIAEHARLTRAGRPHEAVRTRVAQKIDEVDSKIASLRRVREELARVVGCACDSLDHCTCGAAYLARGGRDPQLGPLLHVTNGESAGNTLRQTGLGGAVLSWQDVLHEGPVPAVPPAELRAVRAQLACAAGEPILAPDLAAASSVTELSLDALAAHALIHGLEGPDAFDTAVTPGWLDHLAAAATQPDVATVTPRVTTFASSASVIPSAPSGRIGSTR